MLDDRGRVLGSGRRPLETRTGKPGLAEQDPRAWTAGALAAGAEAVARADGVEIAAIAVGALGPAPVLLDRRLTPLTPALLFSLDRRADEQRAHLALGPDHALPKLLWWQQHEPRLCGRAAWAVDATGFVVSALTGSPAMDSITRADYEHEGVSAPVPLPEPLDPLAIAGRLTRGTARTLGLSPGLPVAAGTYDTYVDVAGTGVRPEEGCILLGSTLAVYAVAEERLTLPGLEVVPSPREGFLVGGTTSAAGAALAWLVGLFGAEEGELAALAGGLEPGSGGLLALSHLAGERAPFWDQDGRAALAGLNLATGRAEIYRAFVDALALSARAIAERLPRPTAWRVSGGGCHNSAWLQATCDALGEPLGVSTHAGEAVGPAVLALRALGVEPVLEKPRVVRPDAERTSRYRALSTRHTALYEALRALPNPAGP